MVVAGVLSILFYSLSKEQLGLIFVFQILISACAGMIFPRALTGWLLEYFGFKANVVQEEGVQTGILLMLSFLPAIGALLSVICIALYPLTEEKITEISTDLEARRK